MVRGMILLVLLSLTLCLPTTVRAAAEQAATGPIPVPNPGADLWREVRQRDLPVSGNTQVQGVQSDVLIATGGEEFRDYRRSTLIPRGWWVLAGVLGAILLFYMARGRIAIDGGRTGRTVQRFSDMDRVTHWFVAGVFIFLALSGLILLFGRFVLLPVIGAEAFGAVASAAKEGHNLFGPLFLVGLALLLFRFVRKNVPHLRDLVWVFKGGGMFGGHASAGYFNAGEKIWFWLVILVGLVISVTGLILLFAVFGQGREIMQLSLFLHGIGALLLIAGSFGHIYLGTAGTEGTLEGMVHGRVDANWARTHHDLWYRDIEGAEAADESARS